MNEISKRIMDEICTGNDKRIPCSDNYLDGEVCRIQCCSTPLCNSATSFLRQFNPDSLSLPLSILKLSLILLFTHSIFQQFFFTSAHSTLTTTRKTNSNFIHQMTSQCVLPRESNSRSKQRVQIPTT